MENEVEKDGEGGTQEEREREEEEGGERGRGREMEREGGGGPQLYSEDQKPRQGAYEDMGKPLGKRTEGNVGQDSPEKQHKVDSIYILI